MKSFFLLSTGVLSGLCYFESQCTGVARVSDYNLEDLGPNPHMMTMKLIGWLWTNQEVEVTSSA